MKESVTVGPIRIPKEYKDGLDQLKAGKPHLSYSSLIREAIYRMLVEERIMFSGLEQAVTIKRMEDNSRE